MIKAHKDHDLGMWLVQGFGMEAIDRSLVKAVAILMRMRTEQ